MKKEDIYYFVQNEITPTEIAEFYLGQPSEVSGDSLKYYSPLRKKENTPSFFVNNKKRNSRFWN